MLKKDLKILSDLVIPIQPPRDTHVRCNGGNQIEITESPVRQKHIRSLKQPLQRTIPKTEAPPNCIFEATNGSR